MFNFDALVIGSATFDTLLKGFQHKIIQDEDFSTARALALACGSKEYVENLEYQMGGGATSIA